MLNLETIMQDYLPAFNGEDTNFRHIARHLFSAAENYFSVGNKKDGEILLKHLQRYLILLNDFSEFRKRELYQQTEDIGGSSCDYVNREYERLRGKLPE